jgi:hypothetical protein
MKEFLDQSFASGGIVNVIFGFMVVEGVALIAFRRVTGHGLGTYQILSLMFPGMFLLLALKGALEAAPWQLIAGWLSAALIAHLGDVLVRLRGNLRPLHRDSSRS